jgi:hypothetical protein
VTCARQADGVFYIDGGQQGQNGQFDDRTLQGSVENLNAGFPGERNAGWHW